MICVCERSITFRAIHVTEGFPGPNFVSTCKFMLRLWRSLVHQGRKDPSRSEIFQRVRPQPRDHYHKGWSVAVRDVFSSADCFSCFSVMFICCCFATGKVRRAASQWFDWPREISSPLFRSVVADDDMYNWCSIAVTVTRSLLMKNTINGRLLDRYSSLSVSDT